MQRWPSAGLPPSPAGWIITTARNRAIDRLRREASREDRHAQAALLHARDEPAEEGAVRDDRLRLIFTCCHPALAHRRAGRADAAAPGRAHHRGDRARLPGARADDGPAAGPGQGQDPRRGDPVPGAERGRPARTASGPVLAVVYLIFNEGYTASSGDRLVREDLCAEAIRLGRLLAELDARRAGGHGAARADAAHRVAPGRPHHRGRRPRAAGRPGPRAAGIAPSSPKARPSSGECLRRNQPGPYQIQAAINAVHSDAPTAAATDWRQILQLYDQLLALAPSPVVALNRAVAVAEVEGPDAALALVDGLDLDGYHLFHAIRADLLRRLGRNAEAASAYDAAIARTENAAERDFLRRSREALN